MNENKTQMFFKCNVMLCAISRHCLQSLYRFHNPKASVNLLQTFLQFLEIGGIPFCLLQFIKSFLADDYHIFFSVSGYSYCLSFVCHGIKQIV